MPQLPFPVEKFYLEAYSPESDRPTVYGVTDMKKFDGETGRGTTAADKYPHLELTLDDGSVLIISSDRIYL